MYLLLNTQTCMFLYVYVCVCVFRFVCTKFLFPRRLDDIFHHSPIWQTSMFSHSISFLFPIVWQIAMWEADVDIRSSEETRLLTKVNWIVLDFQMSRFEYVQGEEIIIQYIEFYFYFFCFEFCWITQLSILILYFYHHYLSKYVCNAHCTNICI